MRAHPGPVTSKTLTLAKFFGLCVLAAISGCQTQLSGLNSIESDSNTVVRSLEGGRDAELSDLDADAADASALPQTDADAAEDGSFSVDAGSPDADISATDASTPSATHSSTPDSSAPSDAATPPSSADAAMTSSTISSDSGIAPTPSTIPKPSCNPEAVLGPDERCYVLLLSPADWDTSQSNCELLGSGWHLAEISSSAVNTFVADLQPENTELWISGVRKRNTSTWYWTASNLSFYEGTTPGIWQDSDVAYSRWASDQPSGGPEDLCARMMQDGYWGDEACNLLESAVCQGPPIGT